MGSTGQNSSPEEHRGTGARGRSRLTRRLRGPWAWLVAAVVLGLSTLVTTAVVKLGEGAATHVVEAVTGPKSVSFSTSSGAALKVEVAQGMGCSGNGWVFPKDSGITSATPPGSGPRRGGRTWDADPAAFGAVPAGDVTLYISATGPTDHAVTLTGLDFHVSTREDAVSGTVLNVAEECGAAGTFRYGKVDLGAAPPVLDAG